MMQSFSRSKSATQAATVAHERAGKANVKIEAAWANITVVKWGHS